MPGDIKRNKRKSINMKDKSNDAVTNYTYFTELRGERLPEFNAFW
jgi:hypothetical protein